MSDYELLAQEIDSLPAMSAFRMTPSASAMISLALRSYERLADENAALSGDAERYEWKSIETAPKDNKKPLLLACFNDDGTLQNIDHDGSWESESESWEIPEVYYFWASANGYVEEPSHWMYQPDWYAALSASAAPGTKGESNV